VKNPILTVPEENFWVLFDCCMSAVFAKCCRISERLSTSIAVEDMDKVVPPKPLTNQKPLRGRPRKVFCSSFFLSFFV